MAGSGGVVGSPVSPAGGAAVESAVLSIMGASFGAMWDAVGEEGMRPFVVSDSCCQHVRYACTPHPSNVIL
jgi:hypothetical protein